MNEHYIEVPCNAEVVIIVSCKKMPTQVEEPVKPDYLKDLGIVDTIRFPPEFYLPVVAIDPIDLPVEPVVEPILVVDPVIEQPVEVPAEPVAEIPVIVNPVVEVPAEPVADPVVEPIAEVPVTDPVAVDPILVVDPVIEQPIEVSEPVLVVDPVTVNPVVEVPAEPVAIEPILVVEPTPNPVIPSEPVVVEIPVIPSEPVVEPVVVVDPVINPVQTLDPTPVVTEPVVEVPVVTPVVVEPIAELPPEHCFCNLDSPLSFADFGRQLGVLTKGLLYPSESDFPIDVLTKGFSSKMPAIKGVEVRTLDRVIPGFLRNIDPDDQQTGNAERATLATRWQGLYQFIKSHASVTAWHYPVKGKRYTHELFVLLLHPQGTVALKAKLVET